nr:MAG TPA: tail protein [Caudoviricetes sp.]DAQ45088.1 MAG TPA: tail protein [Caudoviricetes sp.]
MIITIYDKSGKARAEISAGDSSTQQKGVQSDNVLSLSFTHYEHIPLDVNDYVDFEGERYWLTERYVPAQKSEGEWTYDVKLYGIESMIKRFLVLETTDGNAEPVFTLTATAREHVAMVVKCINNGMGHTTDWKVGRVDGQELIVIDYEGKYCDEALKEIAEKVGGGAEWWVEGQTVNICRCEHGEEIELGYGKGLTSLERETGNSSKFYTRLFAIGSSRNIDAEKYGHSRLMLPGGRQYVEVHTDEYGVYDHYEKDAFSGIYPRRTGEVSSVRSEEVKGDDGKTFTVYYFKDETLSFDPNEYELAGEKKRVSFADGELAGLGESDDHYFEVNFDSKTREFEIITTWPYDDGTQVPGGRLVPKAGDHYILWNVRMPEEYYRKAEEELLAAVEKYNAEHWQDISVYKAPTDHVWVEENNAVLHVGRRVRLVSEKYFADKGYRQSRVTKITRKVNLPSQMDLEISDALQTGALDKVNDSIGELKNYTKSRTEGAALPDVIRSWDSTQPTDNNLFSAKRSMQEFLSCKNNDTAQGLIRFMEGLKLGDGEMGLDAKGGAKLSDVVVDRVHDAKSTPADRVMIGAQGFDLYMGADGKSHMYVDYLVARAKFFAASAEVRKVSYSGGTTIFSNAGSTIAKVTYVFDAAGERVIAYKCYALADDGTTRTMNWWHVGMMALCQTFNVKAGKTERLQNRYYWRMVIGVGQETLEDSKLYDYVILSNVREFVGGEAMLPNKGVRVLADETGRVLRWGGVAVATVYDGELVSMAELFAKQEKGRTYDDGDNVIAQRVFYGYEVVNGGEPDAPAEGDVIVQVGDQIRWKSHGNVIKLSTSTDDNATDSAPAITMYHQIGALWETDAKDSAGQPVRNPYQWKEVTCVISPEQVLLNARRFKLFTDSVDNIIEPYVVMYTIVPSCSCIVRHTATRSTTPEVIEAETVKRVGNTTELLSSSDVKYMADVVWQDGNGVETMALTDVHTRGLYNVKSLKIKAYMLKDAEKMLAECDIAVVTDGEQGEDGKPGTDGKPGADGADGWDGKDAAVVVINPSVLTVDTVKDGSGNPRVDCSGEKVKAEVRIEREGVSIVGECDRYEVVDMMGCSAHIADGGTSRMRIVVDSITRDEYMVGSTKRYIPRTTATATVRIHCATNNSYYYATLTVNVNVSAVWSELTITSEKLLSEYSEISSSVEGMKGELKQYDSKIEQTARNIALKVSQTAVGRKNLLVGSDFRKQSDKWAGNDSYRPYISVLNQYGGCNSVVLENGANTYHGLDFFRVPVKTGKYTAGIMAKFNGKPESGSFAIYVARKDAADKHIGNNSWIPVDVSNVVVGQWSLYSTSFDIEDKCKHIDLCFVYTNNPTAWFAQPMLVEGDEYVGWSLSEDDAEYIGGNLLDNTDTLQTGGNLVVANGNLYTDANSYKGFPTRQVNLLNASDNNRVVLQWDLESGDVVKQGQDYMLSFWAKGKGVFDLLFYKDGNQNIFVEKSNDYGGNTSTDTYGTATIKFKDDYSWQQYWVHWRVMDSNLPKYVQIRCMKGCDLYISQPKLEYGATVTEYRATKTDYIEDKSVAGKLLDTGIDLVHRKITMTADTAEFRANNGKTMAVFTADGLNTSLVKAERLETKGEEAVVKIADGMISVYGRANAPNIRFGVNAEGYAVMEYYDNAGNLLYDLGPAGMSTIKTQAAAISAQQFYPVTNTALTSPYTYELQCKSSMGSYDLKYLCAKGSNNDRLLFGREGFGQSGVLVSSNLGVGSDKALFLYLYSAPRVNGQVVADKNADRGLTTQALAKAADGCYFTSDKNLAVNGRLNNVAIGEFIPFDVKTQSNMQDRILMLHENETISLPRLYFGGWLKQSLSSTTTLVKPDTVRLQVYGGGMFTQRGTWDGTMALEL